MKSACLPSLILGFAATLCAATNPVPLVNQPLSPSAIAPGSSGPTLIVNGAGFVSTSVVLWNGTALATTFVNQNQLTAAVPAANVAVAGTASVTVSSPAPGGGVSNAVPFIITAPLAPLAFAATTYTVGNSVTGVVAADFDNDGKTDLAIINESGPGQVCFPVEQTGSVSVLLGNGSGTFTQKWTYDLDCITTPSGKFSAFGVAAGDFNRDGKADLAVTFRSAGLYSVAIFLGNGDGTFTYLESIPSAASGFDGIAPLTFGDFNRDGNIDFTTGFNARGFSTLGVALGNGDGTFVFQSSFTDFIGILSQATGDFNGDGILDLSAGPAFTFSSNTPILLGNGDGTFTADSTQPATPIGVPVITSDFNGDGILDLASVDDSGTSVVVQVGNGDGTFTARSSQTVNQIFSLLGTADVNGDGKLDLVVDNQTGTALSVLLGNGDGTFQTQLDYPVAGGPFSFASADFNGDGRPDLVSANGDPTITVLLNTSPRTGPAVTLSRSLLNFGTQIFGLVSPPQVLTLTNTGTAVLTVTGLGVAGVDRAAFAQTNTCGSPIAPGASCTITVTFRPDVKGQTAATIMILDNAGNSPQKVTLAGVGTYMQFIPGSLNFGNHAVGTRSLSRTITVTNQGPVTVNLAGIAVAGVNAADFAETTNCGSQLPPAASCSISVTFKPTATGLRTAEVDLSDDAGGSPQKINLAGTGT